MPIRTGSVSYARFRVKGGPSEVDHTVLEALSQNVIKPPSAGAAPELQVGWVAGRHVYDTEFEPEIVSCGTALTFGLRIDTNRVPAELRRAHRAIAEATRCSESETGFVSRREKREAKEEADDHCRQELASGRHLRSKLVPILWFIPERLLLAPVFSDAISSALRDLFDASFDAALQPLSAGALAEEIMSSHGLMRDYEDARPSPFTPPPPAAHGDEDRDVTIPAVPWAWAGPEPKDFLGNEFLIWLWAQTETTTAVLRTPRGEVAVALDRSLDMDCAWDATGKQTLRAEGPTRLPEAAKALLIGKWPRKAGLILASKGEQWELTFQADRFLVTGCKLQRPEEPPASARESLEQRIASIEDLDRVIVALYDTFLQDRGSSSWPARRNEIRQWISGRAGARQPRRNEPEIMPTAVAVI